MPKGQSDIKAAKEKFARGVEVLQAFPAIGRVRARKLMLEFGSPAKVFSASEDRLARNGISPQRLAQMLEILG